MGGERKARRSASIAPRPRSMRSIARCPDLARASRRRRRTSQAGLLGLLGQPVEIEGKRGVTVPVRFTDGAASLGPIPLGQVPAAF